MEGNKSAISQGKGWMLSTFLALVLVIGVGVYATITTINSQKKDEEITKLKGSTPASVVPNDAVGNNTDIDTGEQTYEEPADSPAPAKEEDKKPAEQSSQSSSQTQTQTPTSTPTKQSIGRVISLPEAGIKIKVSDTLRYVSFTYDSRDNASHLVLWGVLKSANVQQAPFAMRDVNEDGMGHIYLYKKGKKPNCQASCPDYKFTVNNWDIYYEGYQQCPDARDAECTSQQAIEKMLTTKSNYSLL